MQEPWSLAVLVAAETFFFGWVGVRKADEIIEKYIRNGELVDGIIPQNYETIDDRK